MTALATALLATPLFGFLLAPPDLAPPGSFGAGHAVALIQSSQSAAAGAAEAAVEEPDLADETAANRDASADDDGAAMDDYARQLRERSDLASVHRTLGIATWASMGLTLALGTIQYHNLYGFFADLEETPCVTGDAVFGQGQCSGTPWIHLTGGLLTAGLYTATFSLSLLMPDPNELGASDSDRGRTVRMHKLLRWVHFGGMLAQMTLGFLIANSHILGLDRANDFGTLQALATVHTGIGLATFGAMSWAAALMIF